MSNTYCSFPKKVAWELRNIFIFEPSIFPELEIKDYEQYHRDLCHVDYLSKLRLDLISDWIVPNSSVLNVCCGEGWVDKELVKRKNVMPYGIDISETAIKKYKEKGFSAKVVDVEKEAINVFERKFDYVLLMEALEHLKNPQKVLLESCKVATKGVIVTMPNSAYVQWRFQMFRGYSPRQSITHLHYWGINDFELFLHEMGLKVLDMRTECGRVLSHLKNFWAYQQCWLIKP